MSAKIEAVAESGTVVFKAPRSWATADAIARALALDVTAFWIPTVCSYFGRVPKARILQAVREAVSDEAAAQIEGLKKQPMGAAAEQLVEEPAGCPYCCGHPLLSNQRSKTKRATEVRSPSRPNSPRPEPRSGSGILCVKIWPHASGARPIPSRRSWREITPCGEHANVPLDFVGHRAPAA